MQVKTSLLATTVFSLLISALAAEEKISSATDIFIRYRNRVRYIIGTTVHTKPRCSLLAADGALHIAVLQQLTMLESHRP